MRGRGGEDQKSLEGTGVKKKLKNVYK